MGRLGKLKRQAIQEANERNLGIKEEQTTSDNKTETNKSIKNKNDETTKRTDTNK